MICWSESDSVIFNFYCYIFIGWGMKHTKYNSISNVRNFRCLFFSICLSGWVHEGRGKWSMDTHSSFFVLWRRGSFCVRTSAAWREKEKKEERELIPRSLDIYIRVHRTPHPYFSFECVTLPVPCRHLLTGSPKCYVKCVKLPERLNSVHSLPRGHSLYNATDVSY